MMALNFHGRDICTISRQGDGNVGHDVQPIMKSKMKL